MAESQLIPRNQLHPNPWNVNRQNAFQYAKLLESIDEYGFIDPILARACERHQHQDLEIVGGQHRWQAAGDLLAKHPELEQLPVVVREMDDFTARKLSLIDNELHGQADPIKLSELLKEMMQTSPKEMLQGLPYTDDILKSLTGFKPLPSLPAAPSSGEALSPGEAAAGRWVERTFRMPAEVAEVLDEALAKAKAEFTDEASDFQALEVLAAEYLAS